MIAFKFVLTLRVLSWLGCGKWTQPEIDNPKYKGKWHASLINNPDYKGKWKPRKIPNPGKA